MNRKTKIIVSVVGITIVLLALLGITYAYYLTRIEGNTNTNSISATTADLKLKYDDGSGAITALDIMPGKEIEKTFSVTNEGNSKVNGYAVVLENVVNGLTRKEDLIYTLTCKLPDNTSCGTVTDAIFPSTSKTFLIYTNDINIGATHNYTLLVTYKNHTDIDQSIDMGSSISAKVNIMDSAGVNSYATGDTTVDNTKLAYHILNNKALVENYDENGTSTGLSTNSTINTISTVTGVADNGDESGIVMSYDDDGPSYIYRGTVRNNYVDFAGFTWRIVRINGDGTIRLILDGTLDKVCNSQNSTVCTTSKFNGAKDDNAYVGYMYGLTGMTESDDTNKCLKLVDDTVTDLIGTYSTESTCTEAGGTWTTSAYEATHANIKSSTIKKKIDSFYEAFLQTNYSGYLADSIFCGDKSVADSSVGSSNTALGYGIKKTYYGAYERLDNSSTSTPTLKCNGRFSNYSVSENLTYPIALLNADELMLSGAFISTENQKYYLYNSSTLYSAWWTLAPNYFSSSNAFVFLSSINYVSLSNGSVFGSSGARPVINLGTNVLYDGGSGTVGDKYTVKLAS